MYYSSVIAVFLSSQDRWNEFQVSSLFLYVATYLKFKSGYIMFLAKEKEPRVRCITVATEAQRPNARIHSPSLSLCSALQSPQHPTQKTNTYLTEWSRGVQYSLPIHPPNTGNIFS